MPFEVTPFFPRLARYTSTAPTDNSTAAANTAAPTASAPSSAPIAVPSN